MCENPSIALSGTSEVVRDRIGKRLQLPVGRFESTVGHGQLRRSRRDQLFEVLALFAQFLFRPLQLGDVLGHGKNTGHPAIRVDKRTSCSNHR